jgi:fructoselysine-6-P-deglycase FrlB-like protein
MQLRLSDRSYTDRLANFLRSLGQTVFVAGPGQLEVDLEAAQSSRREVELYLRVWSVLYPDAEVHADNGEDEAPAA